MNVLPTLMVVIKSASTLKDCFSAAAMIAIPWRVMEGLVLMMMSVHWEYTTVSSSVSTLLGDSDASVTQATNSTPMEPTAQVKSYCLADKKKFLLKYPSLHVQISMSVLVTMVDANSSVPTVMVHSHVAVEVATY